VASSLEGMRCWVGLGMIADNIIQMGCYLARQNTEAGSAPPSMAMTSYGYDKRFKHARLGLPLQIWRKRKVVAFSAHEVRDSG
jgi:hypothetical protein